MLLMSALGQKQPLKSAKILASERLVMGQSRHSPYRLSENVRGWFRSQAAARSSLETKLAVGTTELSLMCCEDVSRRWKHRLAGRTGILAQRFVGFDQNFVDFLLAEKNLE